MPQLDKITFFSQFFWLSFFYLGFYFLIYKYFLPKMSRALKFRKRRMSNAMCPTARQSSRHTCFVRDFPSHTCSDADATDACPRCRPPPTADGFGQDGGAAGMPAGASLHPPTPTSTPLLLPHFLPLHTPLADFTHSQRAKPK